MTLQALLDCLTFDRNIHIFIHDLSGILAQPKFNLAIEKTHHSMLFCSYAKSTSKGYKICVDCKRRAVQKAIRDKTIFTGRCIYGIHEVIQPIEIEGAIAAIIFISNITKDIAFLENHFNKMSRILEIPNKGFHDILDSICISDDFTPYIKTAEFIRDFIVEFYNNTVKNKREIHWMVSQLINYINEYYDKENNMSLSRLSKLYYFDENYIGRVFKKQTGKTFSQYLNGIRLKRSLDLLLNTDRAIIDIAFAVGFNNVTYYNRLFKKRFGVSPSQYRKI